MLRSVHASLLARAAGSQHHSNLPSSSTVLAVTSAFSTTNAIQCAHSLSRSKSTSAVVESPSDLQFRVNSENGARRSDSHDQDEANKLAEAMTEGSLQRQSRGTPRFSGVDELVEARAAKLFMLLAPQVKARSITDRQALLNRSNVGK